MLLKCCRVLAHESWTCELVIKLLWAAVLAFRKLGFLFFYSDIVRLEVLKMHSIEFQVYEEF